MRIPYGLLEGGRMRLLGVVFALLIGTAVVGEGLSAAPLPQEGSPQASASVVYDLSQPGGPIRVSWQVEVSNFDPSTAYGGGEYIYYYTALPVPILRGATNVVAYGPGGGALYMETIDFGDGPIYGARVSFDRNLYYGESYHFSLSYELAAVRAKRLLVTPSYYYFPAFSDGLSSAEVTVKVPEDASWQSALLPGTCETIGERTYRCDPSSDIPLAAFVEVSRPADIRTTTASIEISRGRANVSIRYFPGEEEWAHHLRELIPAALPVLEKIFGVPFPGELGFVVAERGQQDLAGYEGLFDCAMPPRCEISISPVTDDVTTIHELAHFWTERFDDRWMGEGWAEFAAQRVADQLGPLITTRFPREISDPDVFPLATWGRVSAFVTNDEEAELHELSGYARSRRFVEVLESEIGLPALQAANAAANLETVEDVNSDRYLDLLEEASGQPLDDLFLEWVFEPSDAERLEERRPVRDRYQEFKTTIGAAGLDVPKPIDSFLRVWRFDMADSSIDAAEDALDAYTEARDRVDDSRNVWQRIGLIGEDPGKRLDDAAASFEDGDFVRSIDHADAARSMIDGAGTAALYRLLIASGALVAVAAVSSGGFWFLRRRLRAR